MKRGFRGRFAVLLALACANSALCAETAYPVGAQSKTCAQLADLDAILARQDPKYLMHLPDQTYDELRAWVRGCSPPGWNYASANRLQLLDQAQAEKRRAAEAAESAQRRKDAADVAAVRKQEQDEARAAAQQRTDDELARRSRDKQCRESAEYVFFLAEERVMEDRKIKREAQATLADEQRVGAVSGYVNKARMHDAGARIVWAEDDLKRAWADYRNLGGKAASPQAVKHVQPNPCDG